MKKLVCPRNILIFFILVTLMYLLYTNVMLSNSKKSIWDFILIYVLFFPTQLIVLVSSCANSKNFYKKNKKEFILSIIPVIVIGLFLVYIIARMLYILFFQ